MYILDRTAPGCGKRRNRHENDTEAREKCRKKNDIGVKRQGSSVKMRKKLEKIQKFPFQEKITKSGVVMRGCAI